MSKFSIEEHKTDSEQRLRALGKKLRQQNNKSSNNGEEFLGYQKVSDSYKILKEVEGNNQKENKAKNHFVKSPDLEDDKFSDESPNLKPKSVACRNHSNEPFDIVIGSNGEKKVHDWLKLVNARDPPNKFFESTVNLANKDAWKRRSIYLSKAQFQFEPHNNEAIRHSVNVPFESGALSREDSDDYLWNNVDECIGEYDRVIPVVMMPKSLSALKDKYLPLSIQKMLKNSTRFSHSFHINRDSKAGKRDSVAMFGKVKSASQQNSKITEQHKQAIIEKGNKAKEFFKYRSSSDSSDADDKWNIQNDDDYHAETIFSGHSDSLKKYNISTVFSKCEFNSLEKTKKSKTVVEDPRKAASKKRDSYVDKIEDLDNKRETLSELTIQPKKEKSLVIPSTVTPFKIAPQIKKEEEKRGESDIVFDKSQKISLDSTPKDDRESIDLWRASQMDNDNSESNNDLKHNFASKVSKDDILSQWLKNKPRDNGTITEDIDAEDASDSNRISRSTGNSISTVRASEPKQDNFENEEEEENELHQIHMLQSLQALQYMKGISLPPMKEVRERMVFLPPPKNPHITKTLIFDMDETLIHCVDDIDEENPQTVLDVIFEDGEVVEAGINVRPYAIDCLKAANELFQVIVFTASHKCYADVVLDYIDPTGELIQYRLYRDSWYKTSDNVYIKDLRIIENRKLKDLVIVDNAVYSFGFQLDNGIPIIPYYDDPNDEELYHLIPYLDILAESEDVREKNKEAFQLQEMAKQNAQDLEYFEK